MHTYALTAPASSRDPVDTAALHKPYDHRAHHHNYHHNRHHLRHH
jgi:hypothetical protein